jgi:hypothetical protein
MKKMQYEQGLHEARLKHTEAKLAVLDKTARGAVCRFVD